MEHELISEVYFTVLGEDESGRRISAKAPGEIRIVRRSLKVIMPSVSDDIWEKRLTQHSAHSCLATWIYQSVSRASRLGSV